MHHAYVYEGSQELLEALARHARKLFGFGAEHNPDVRVQSFEKFGIDDAAALKAATSFKTVSGRALYCLGMSTIATEAQQALLKLFEEPQLGVIFVLLVPHGSLLPTLRSRFLEYPGNLQGSTLDQGSSRSNLNTEVKKFLAASYKERSEQVTTLLNPPAGGEEGVRERVRDFVNALETALYATVRPARSNKELLQGLGDIARVRDYLRDRSPSLKMLLEHLATALPRFDLEDI